MQYTPDVASNYYLSTSMSGYSNAQTVDNAYDPSEWRIMSIDKNGNITNLFGIGKKGVAFGKSVGYNNGVYLLNDICKNRYGNATLGAIARNLNIEDIELRMNATGIAARNAYKSGTVQYGTTKRYSGNNIKYPAIYAQEKYSGIGVSDVADGTQVVLGTNTMAQSKMNRKGKKGSDNIYTILPSTSETLGTDVTSLTCTQTWYTLRFTNKYFSDINFGKLIFGNGISPFYLASRCINCSDSNFPMFGIYTVLDNSIKLSTCLDNLERAGKSFFLAPVVTFYSEIQIYSGTGTVDDPYVIGK